MSSKTCPLMIMASSPSQEEKAPRKEEEQSTALPTQAGMDTVSDPVRSPLLRK